MKKPKLIIILSIIIFLSAALWYGIFYFSKPYISKLNGQLLSTEQKLEDFNYFYNTMKDNYPFFEVKKRMLNYDWLAHKDEFEDRIRNTKNDREFYTELNKIVNLVQNAHTHILEGSFYQELKAIYEDPQEGYSPSRRDILNNEKALKMLDYWKNKLTAYDHYIPMIFKYIEGSYVVLDGNLEDYDIPRGAILLKVNDIKTNDYIKSLSDKTYLYYDYKLKKQKLDELIIFAESNEEVKLTLNTPDDETIEVLVKEDHFYDYVYQRNYEVRDNGKNYELVKYSSSLIQGSIAYIKLKSMDPSEGFSFEEDGRAIYDFLKEIEDYPYLIVDIRGNGGGSDWYWKGNLVRYLIDKHTYYDTNLLFKDSEYIKPFIEEIHSLYDAKTTDKLPTEKNYPPEVQMELKYFVTIKNDFVPYNPVKFKGKIFMLVDGEVYSAAESFASFAKSTGWATLVGTTTGGDGISADPALMMLPNSGIVIRFSSSMGLNPNGTANEEYHTTPDKYVEQSYDDFLAKIKNGEPPKEVFSRYDTVMNRVLDIIKSEENK